MNTTTIALQALAGARRAETSSSWSGTISRSPRTSPPWCPDPTPNCAAAFERSKAKAASAMTVPVPAGLDGLERLHVVGLGPAADPAKPDSNTSCAVFLRAADEPVRSGVRYKVVSRRIASGTIRFCRAARCRQTA